MSQLKQMIKTEFDKDRALSKKVAEIAGFKNPTPLYKFLNEEDREMDSFGSLLKIVRYLFPEKETQVMDEYCRTLEPSKKAARHALEYACSNRCKDLAYFLLEKLSSCKNADSREWGNIYTIYFDVDEGRIDYLDAINLTNIYKYRTIEMSVFGKLIQLYEYYGKKLYEVINEIIPLVSSEINLIKDEFIKNEYMIRLGIIVVAISLRNNEVEKVRKYGEFIINTTSNKKIIVMILIHIGNSYLFESYKKAMDYFNRAIEYCKYTSKEDNKMIEITRSINLTQTYWNVEAQHLLFTSKEIPDVHEVAFDFIRQNKNHEAVELLNRMNLEVMTENHKGFHYYYLGLANKSEDFFFQSILHFKQSGDKFYRRLPLIELEKLGINKFALMALEA